MTTYEDQHAAGLYRAMALRFYMRYVEMRHSAEFRGGDLPAHGRLPTRLEASEHYRAAVDEYLFESLDSVDAAQALVRFAGIPAADQFITEVVGDAIGGEEQDAFDQVIALGAVSHWLSDQIRREDIEQERKGRKPTGQPGEVRP